ncbi:MAG: pentapeptide repeat-containing protein, partial [bacterium]
SLTRAVLSDAILAGADLSNANLSRARLNRADLRGANLIDAVGAEADLNKANLSRANLNKTVLKATYLIAANLVEANLNRADLSEAILLRADLRGADLRKANFSGAVLNEATFSGANLNQANFLGADLTNAILAAQPDAANARTDSATQSEQKDSDAVGQASSPGSSAQLDATLAGTHFAMAQLTGARVPSSVKIFADTLDKIADTAKNARSVFVALISLCAYLLLTTASTTDAQIVLHNSRIDLPIIAANMPASLFFVGTVLVILFVFSYFQMYLSHLWELAGNLPAVFPDGQPLRKKLYPWMMNLLIETWQKERLDGLIHKLDLHKNKSLFDKFRALIAATLGWGLFPFTTLMVTYRFLVTQDRLLKSLLFGLFVGSLLLASIFYERAKAVVRNQRVKQGRLKALHVAASLLFAGFLLTVALPGGGLLGVSANIQLHGTDLQGTIFGTVDLSSANFSFANLDQADFRRTRLIRADLHGANLRGAELDSADLSEANLHGAKLQQASFRGAILRGTDLAQASGLTAAQLSQAKTLVGAKLDSSLAASMHKNYPHLLQKLEKTN